MQTLVREYKDAGEFAHDAKKLARDGWAVKDTAEFKERVKLLPMVATLGFTAIRGKKPHMVVTYQRER